MQVKPLEITSDLVSILVNGQIFHAEVRNTYRDTDKQKALNFAAALHYIAGLIELQASTGKASKIRLPSGRVIMTFGFEPDGTLTKQD